MIKERILDMSKDFVKYLPPTLDQGQIDLLGNIIELVQLDNSTKRELAQLWVNLNVAMQ